MDQHFFPEVLIWNWGAGCFLNQSIPTGSSVTSGQFLPHSLVIVATRLHPDRSSGGVNYNNMHDRFFEQVAAITEGASKGAQPFQKLQLPAAACCLLILQSMYDRYYYVSFKTSDPGHIQRAVALMDHSLCLTAISAAASLNATNPDPSLPLIIKC
jgi:hypothetical protein